MKKLDYKFWECARKMPPLQHVKSKPFDITQSEVAKWLASQPEVGISARHNAKDF